jgi:RNA polymerase sigma factor (sigma-70 family)
MQSDFDPPDKRMIFDEQSRLVAGAMAQLPYEQREVIALHLNAAMKLKHIAGLQNVSVSTIKGRYRYGIQKLRSALNGRL